MLEPSGLDAPEGSLMKEPQCVWNFPWQDEIYVTEDFADAGGYAKTGHSTSGGVFQPGGHTLCAWSSSLKAVALSSCESEYYSLVRCVDEATDLDEMLEEMQSNHSIRRWARGLALRAGGGQIKHMQAKYYWLQECIKAGILTVEKIRGTVNPADLMTKHLDGTTMRAMCGLLDLKFETGRAAAAPKLEIDSGYVTRCAKLLAAVSLLPAVRGEPNEHHEEKYTWVASVIAMGVLVLLVLATVWVTFARRQARTVINPCDKDTMTMSMMANTEHMSGVELVWTERGERLHMSRECPALRNSKHLRSKTICKLCARDNK